LICGSRVWTDGELILSTLRDIHARERVDVVIEGEAPGADTLARQAAEHLGIPVLAFPADWERYGRGAGPRRNQQMIDEGHPDIVLAFSEDLNSSRGTADMVAQARRAGLPVRLISHTGAKSL
jgi:hypothetical protein